MAQAAFLALSASRFAFAKSDTQVDLRIVATTDIHSFLTDFDYYKDAPTEKFGFTRAASLIRQARQEVKNSVLVDNGDLIQGNPIADYQAAKGYKEGKSNPAVDCLKCCCAKLDEISSIDHMSSCCIRIGKILNHLLYIKKAQYKVLK